MPMESKCHPCLPPTLIERFKADYAPYVAKSHIFGDHFQQFRHGARIINGSCSDKKPTPVEVTVVIPKNDGTGHAPGFTALLQVPTELTKNMDNFTQKSGKTWLHLATVDADVALAHEIIRMGIIIDYKDSDGVTPLFNAMIYLLSLRKVLELAEQPGFLDSVPRQSRTSMKPVNTAGRIQRVRDIVSLLVNQHADVNAGALQHTPLSLAALAGEWGLVELFLKYGARKPLRVNDLLFASNKDKIKFSSISSTTKALKPRPDRPCPCWSGKLLTECHAAEQQPYPNHFICGCGRRKTYGTCCGKRGIQVVESWDESDKWIKPSELRTVPLPNESMLVPDAQPLFDAGLNSSFETMQQMRGNPELMKKALDTIKGNSGNILLRLSQISGRQHLDLLDPAFIYALNNTDFWPQPWKDKLSKIEANKRMAEFNDAVDRYILAEGDPRFRLEIETKAKIDSHGGPLYKSCELESCGKTEKRDVDKLQCCGGCKMIFYCSRECQVADYKNHKAACKAKSHSPQLLDSQWEMTALMSGMTALGGMQNLSL